MFASCKLFNYIIMRIEYDFTTRQGRLFLCLVNILTKGISSNLLMKNRALFFRENSIFRKLLFELQTIFEGFAHSFVYQIVAMCIWIECKGID